MSAYQLPPWVWPVALIGVCGVAVRRGGNEERLAIGAVVLGWALTILVYKRADDTQWQIVAIDGAVFAIYMSLALRSRRYWPLFAAAFKFLALITHFGPVLEPGISTWAYWTAEILWSYLALFAIGYGAWTAPRHGRVVSETAPKVDLSR